MERRIQLLPRNQISFWNHPVHNRQLRTDESFQSNVDLKAMTGRGLVITMPLDLPSLVIHSIWFCSIQSGAALSNEQVGSSGWSPSLVPKWRVAISSWCPLVRGMIITNNNNSREASSSKGLRQQCSYHKIGVSLACGFRQHNFQKSSFRYIYIWWFYVQCYSLYLY